MSLQHLTELLKCKGFPKSATLIKSETGKLYIHYLSSWSLNSNLIRKELGEEIINLLLGTSSKIFRYDYLSEMKEMEKEEKNERLIKKYKEYMEKIFISNTSGFFIDKIFNKDEEKLFEISFESKFSKEDLRKAEELEKKAEKIISFTKEIINNELENIADDTLFEVYKDTEKPDISEPHIIKRRMKKRCEQLEFFLIEQNPVQIIKSGYDLLSQYIIINYDESKNLEENCKEIIEKTKKLLTDEKEFNLNLAYLEENFEMLKKKKIIEKKRKEIKDNKKYYLMKKEKDKETEQKEEEDIFQTFLKKALFYIGSEKFKEEEESDSELVYKGFDFLKDQDDLEKIVKMNLHQKEMILVEYQHTTKKISDTLKGIQQILEGGTITNPNASKFSIKQNHNNYPNIKYSKKAMQEFKKIFKELKKIENNLPDLNDLSAPSKLKRKNKLKYSIQKMPKDPLDLDFGKDAGCCLEVTDTYEKLENGVFVPIYLINPYINLFSITLERETKKQRMGLILAFITKNKENKKILACNSIELSRMGIAGGKKTIKNLINYAEKWIINYAKTRGFDGAVMGKHIYNTSANYSKKTEDILEEKLTIESQPFYSDIMEFNEEENIMETRKSSCYWLWKKQGKKN
jgi:hypothetical protein